MSLFPSNPTENLLPFDGTVNYFGKIIPLQEANYYFDILMNNIEWRNDEQEK